MILPSKNVHLEVSKLVNGYLLRYTFECGAGSVPIHSDPIWVQDVEALKHHLALLHSNLA